MNLTILALTVFIDTNGDRVKDDQYTVYHKVFDTPLECLEDKKENLLEYFNRYDKLEVDRVVFLKATCLPLRVSS